MKHSCPHCGKEINPAKMLGGVRTPKKEAAWKANGERLKKMYANARKVGAQVIDHGETKVVIGRPQSFVDPEFAAQLKKDNPALPFIAPKGSFSKEDLKALIQGGRPAPKVDTGGITWSPVKPTDDYHADAGLEEVPHAPFDFKDEEGNPHRVRAYGKTLKVCFLRDGVEEPIRNLREGELEQLWEKRTQ